MKAQLRPAELSDLQQILQFVKDFYAEDGHHYHESDARQAVQGLLQNPNYGGIWLIEHDRSVGYLAVTMGYSLEYKGLDAFVDELYVQPNYRGLGLGTKAMQWAEKICQERGIRALHLEVEFANSKAQEFYRKVGYEAHSRILMTKFL